MAIRREKPNTTHAHRCLWAALLMTLALGPGMAAGQTDPIATTGGDPFAAGEMVAFAGLSAGPIGGYGRTLIPPVNAGFDFAFQDYLTAGAYFAFSRYDLYSSDLSYLSFAARGTFHPTFWFQRMKIPLDPYGIATVGFMSASWSGPGSNTYSQLIIGPSVGARYWFTPRLAAQAEAGLGQGVSLASIGLALKL